MITDYIKALFKWVVSKESFSSILFSIRCAKTLFGKYFKFETIDKLNAASEMLDKVNKVLPNDKTKALVKTINQDQKTFRGFTAKLAPHRHGDGNHGLVLGYSDGGVSFGVGFGKNGVCGEVKIEI